MAARRTGEQAPSPRSADPRVAAVAERVSRVWRRRSGGAAIATASAEVDGDRRLRRWRRGSSIWRRRSKDFRMPCIAMRSPTRRTSATCAGGRTPSRWPAPSATTPEGAGCDGRSRTARGPAGRGSLPPRPLRPLQGKDVWRASDKPGPPQRTRARLRSRQGPASIGPNKSARRTTATDDASPSGACGDRSMGSPSSSTARSRPAPARPRPGGRPASASSQSDQATGVTGVGRVTEHRGLGTRTHGRFAAQRQAG